MIQLKDDYQISKIRSSCHLLSDMFDEVGPQVVEGISTYDIDRLCFCPCQFVRVLPRHDHPKGR